MGATTLQLPPHSGRLQFRWPTEADIEPLRSYQSREDYAVHAWREPSDLDDVVRTVAAHRGPRRWARGGDSLNTASARVCERVGMRHEATLSESHRQLGEWRNELLHAVLESERGSAGSS